VSEQLRDGRGSNPSRDLQLDRKGVVVHRSAEIAAALFALCVALLYGFDGPFWQLTLPSTIPPALRSDVARLRSWSGSTRASACIGLSLYGPAASPAAPMLVGRLDDHGYADGWWQGFSRSLSFHGGPHTVNLEAAKALQAIGSAAVPSLIDGLRNPREQVRMFAAELLGSSLDFRAVPPLRAAAQSDPSVNVRNSAVRALAHLHDREVLDSLVHNLHDAEDWRRANAAVLLGSSGAPDMITPLRQALDDPAPSVRTAAQAAIQRIESGLK
jgi:hypothetical protein